MNLTKLSRTELKELFDANLSSFNDQVKNEILIREYETIVNNLESFIKTIRTRMHYLRNRYYVPPKSNLIERLLNTILDLSKLEE